MRLQWQRFSHLLWGTIGAVWLLCSSGLLLAGEERWQVRLALAFMLIAVTAVGLRFWLIVRRELKVLERQGVEIRAAMSARKAERSSCRPREFGDEL